MKKFKLPEQMFKNALSKCEEFKEFANNLNERAKAFEHYINALRIEYDAYFEITFKYHHIDWPDEEMVYVCKFAMHPKDTITGNIKNYKNILLDLFVRHFKDSFDTGELEWYHKISSISIVSSEYCMQIASLIAWSSDYVGIYWVEQECGAHWITLPKKPEVEIATYLRVE